MVLAPLKEVETILDVALAQQVPQARLCQDAFVYLVAGLRESGEDRLA